MKKFRTVLAATDLSSESLSAVRYAAHLAKAQGAKLVIVHATMVTMLLFPYYDGSFDIAGLEKDLEDNARTVLDSWVKRHAKGEPATRVIVRRGEAHEVLCQVAAETGASVIVIATHGRKGFSHALLGSVTERVLRDAPCPVLVVRPKAPVIHVEKAA
ncbi:MAG TPA: universal stress protein [Candidatus Binatia bacterium]